MRGCGQVDIQVVVGENGEYWFQVSRWPEQTATLMPFSMAMDRAGVLLHHIVQRDLQQRQKREFSIPGWDLA